MSIKLNNSKEMNINQHKVTNKLYFTDLSLSMH